jgi:ATP-dependent helicase YprA (DUF1998 family)
MSSSNNNNSNKTRCQTEIRDEKRKQFQELFEQKLAIQQQMDALEKELIQLDNEIETLEEHEHGNQTKTSPLSLPLTLNPEEILPEPASTLTTEGEEHLDLTDPRTQEITHSQEEQIPPARLPLQPQPNSNKTLPSLPPLQLKHVEAKPTAKRRRKEVTTIGNCPFTPQQLNAVLHDTFHINSFRENQLEIIQTTLSGQDCFVIMRTGGGKSLTYQLPMILERPKVTLVISPLLSLIQDQQQQMNSFLPDSCVSFTSGMGTSEHTQNWQRVRDPNGGVGMILVTPEKVYKSNKLKSELQKLYEQQRLARFVIDECHCACQWGRCIVKTLQLL